MTRLYALGHKFVEFIPAQLESGVVYVSVEYATVVHLCCCGCGRKVVTPLSPAQWKFTFDGETISLSPSIGNWDLPCNSHYWIWQNEVDWAPAWTKRDVEHGRRMDRQVLERHFGKEEPALPVPQERPAMRITRQVWARVRHLLLQRLDPWA